MSHPMAVTEPIERAMGYTRRTLFQPFLFNRWLSLGVIIFFESLVQGGGATGVRIPGSGSHGSGGAEESLSEAINQGVAWVTAHLIVVVPVGALVMALILGFLVVIAWIGSRGQIMFVRAVALEDASIGENWHGARETYGSLFHFRLFLMGAALVVSALALLFMGAVAIGLAAQGIDSIWPYMFAMLPALLVWVPFSIGVWIVGLLLRNFVAPLMWLRTQSCADAWREFGVIARANKLSVALVLLLRAAYFLGFAVVSLLIGCMTCCLGFLPVLHQTLFAPFYVFDRAYTLGVLESLGPDYAFFLRGGLHELGEEPPALP